MSDWRDAPIASSNWQDAPIAEDSPELKTERAAGTMKLMTRPGTPLGTVVGLGEAGLTIGSGLVSTIGSGYAGMVGADVENVQREGTYQPRTDAGEQTLEGVAEGVGLLEEGVGNVVAGVSDMITGPRRLYRQILTGEKDDTPTLGDEIREHGVGVGVGNVVADETGSPALATLARITPEALASVYGMRRPTNIGETAKRTLPSGQAEEVVEALKTGNQKRLSELVDADPELIKAFEELGVPYTPGAVTTNNAFRQSQSALKSQQSSQLKNVDAESQAALDANAARLVEDFGGTTDRSLLNANVRADYEDTIRRMEIQADEAFDALPKQFHGQRIAAERLQEYLNEQIRRFGSPEELLQNGDGVDKTLFRMMHRRVKDAEGDTSWQPVEPTYGSIDKARSNVGKGVNHGPFKDDDIGTLKHYYELLADAQHGAARRFGFDDELVVANDLIVRRKAVEDAATQALGRNLERGLVPQLDSAANALVRGNVEPYTKLINAVPKEFQRQVSLSVLNNLFSTGTQKGVRVTEAFVQNWRALQRNEVARKEIFKHLPKEARKRFNLMGRVAEAFYKSKIYDSKSNSANNLVSSMDDGTIIRRLYDIGREGMRMEGVTTPSGVPGAGLGVAVVKSGLLKSTPKTVAADRLLSSLSFREAMRRYADGAVDEANSMLTQSAEWRRYAGFVDEASAEQIAKSGPILWMISRDDNE